MEIENFKISMRFDTFQYFTAVKIYESLFNCLNVKADLTANQNISNNLVYIGLHLELGFKYCHSYWLSNTKTIFRIIGQ